MSNTNENFGICDHHEYEKCSCYKYYEDEKKNNDVNRFYHLDRSGGSRSELHSSQFSRKRQ